MQRLFPVGQFMLLILLSLTNITPILAEEANITLGGFIKADFGTGDRFNDNRGEDRLGVSKAAIALKAELNGITGVIVYGTERLTDGNGNNDGDTDLKDAFIVIDELFGQKIDLTMGAQPVLFGLKPNGYPGDRSIQPSVEYGAAGAFSVADQSGPAIMSNYRLSDALTLRVGFFDLDSSSNFGNSGSQINDNGIIELRASTINDTNFYGLVGLEYIYVGGAVDSSKPIFDLGLGWQNNLFDISAEYIRLDQAITGTNEDETYFIVESTYQLSSDLKVYADWANADELDVDTFRLGTGWQWHPNVSFALEWAYDRVNGNDNNSLDLRCQFEF